MPCTPIAERLSFTSSSLNGLMIASTFFMVISFRRGRCCAGPRLLQARAACTVECTPSPSVHRAALLGRSCAEGRVGAVAAAGEHVRALAVLREVEPGELVVLAYPEAAEHHPGDGEAEERAHYRQDVGEQHGDHLVAEEAPLAGDEEPRGDRGAAACLDGPGGHLRRGA